MKKIIKIIIQKLMDLKVKILMIFKNNFITLYLKCFCSSLEKYTNNFYSINIRPKYINKDKNYSLKTNDHLKTAIILQGPIYKDFDFTLETVKYYKNTMKNIEIIISTWNGESEKEIQILKNLGVEVVLSNKPKYTGVGNINFQVKSTIMGLKKAEELNCIYAMKTRTDQRYEKNNFLEFLFSLIDGMTSDLIKLFDFDEMDFSETKEDRAKSGKKMKKVLSISDYIAMRAPEVMIIKNYISCKDKIPIENTVKNYWGFVKNNLITLSHEEIGFFWVKYESRLIENNINFNYFENDSGYGKYTWNFSNWFSLYQGYIIYDKNVENYSKQLADRM